VRAALIRSSCLWFKLGLKRPQRVFVRFLDDAFEGRQDWVPPGRLKAPWGEVDAFLARERRWDAVLAQSPERGAPEQWAAVSIFGSLIDRGLATLCFNATEAVVTIDDVAGLAPTSTSIPTDCALIPCASRRTSTSSRRGPSHV
jgi:hypothetical protein